MNVLTLDGEIRSPIATFTVFENSDRLREAVNTLGSERSDIFIHYTNARSALIAFDAGIRLINNELEILVFEKSVLLIQQKIESVDSIADAAQASKSICRDLDRLSHKKDYNTLLDIVSTSKKSKEITTYFVNMYIAHDLNTTSKISRMIVPNDVLSINYEDLLLKGSIALVAKMGEGKNVKCIEPWFADAAQNGKMPIYIAPLKSLLDKSIGTAEHYNSLPETDNPRNGLRTTANSFVTGKFAEFRKHSKVLFIDEVVRLTEQLNGNAFFSGSMEDKLFGWKLILESIKNAKNVVLADAHLGQEYLNIIKQLTGKNFPAFQTPTSTYGNIKVSLGCRAAELIAFVKAKKDQGISSSYFFDGKIEDGKALEATFIRAGLRAIYLYSAERNVAGSKILEVSKNPESLDNYDVVICSPYIGPGWACAVESFKAVMIHCCGTVSPASVLQSIKRFRAVENVYIAFDMRSASRCLPVQEKDVAFLMAANEMQDEEFSVGATLKVARDFIKDQTGRAICKLMALENYSRNRYEQFIYKALQILGFSVEIIDPDVKVAASESRKLKKEKDSLANEKLNLFRSDKFLDAIKLNELKTLKRNKGVSLADSWLIEKSEASLLMNKKGLLTEAELYFLLNQNGVELIKRCGILYGDFKKTHTNFVKFELFKDLLGFVESKVYTTGSITAFFAKMKSSKLKWNGKELSKFTLLTRTIFELKGVAGGSYIAMKNVLKLLGFKMSSSACKTAGKYEVDCSLYEMATRYLSKNAHPGLDHMAINSLSENPNPEFDYALQVKNKHKMDKLRAVIHDGNSERVIQHEAIPA